MAIEPHIKFVSLCMAYHLCCLICSATYACLPVYDNVLPCQSVVPLTVLSVPSCGDVALASLIVLYLLRV